MTRPFDGLRPYHYGAILADPPWRFEARTPAGDGRAPPYARMSVPEIAALPVGELAARDCALFLWMIDPLLPAGLAVMEAWGFRFATVAFTWAKQDGFGLFPMCTGYWTRANPEMCLLGTRGAPKRRHADVRQLVPAPAREHSRKPDRINTDIERLVGGPYAELFARTRRPGWDSWGDEVGRFGETSPIGQSESGDG